jgi:DNA-binding CsgD family transcriptional regulator
MPAGPLSRLLLTLHDASFGTPVETVKEALLEALRPAIAFDSAIWGSGAEDPPLIFGIATVDFSLEQLVAYGRWQAEDRLRAACAARPGTALRQEDIGSIHTHHASPIYLGFCRDAGIAQTLGIADLDPATRVGELVFLFRGPGAPAFTDAERDLLEQCFPHMQTARRRRMLAAFGPGNGHLPGADDPDCEGYAIVDDAGHVHASDRAFGVAVRGAFPDWLGPRLPPPLAALAGNGATALKAGGLRFELKRGGERHLLRLLDPGLDPLSQAELRVARMFAQGMTAPQVAARLHLSPRTVRNHLAAIYAKLGFHSKAELARHMQARDG